MTHISPNNRKKHGFTVRTLCTNMDFGGSCYSFLYFGYFVLLLKLLTALYVVKYLISKYLFPLLKGTNQCSNENKQFRKLSVKHGETF